MTPQAPIITQEDIISYQPENQINDNTRVEPSPRLIQIHNIKSDETRKIKDDWNKVKAEIAEYKRRIRRMKTLVGEENSSDTIDAMSDISNRLARIENRVEHVAHGHPEGHKDNHHVKPIVKRWPVIKEQ